MAFWRYDLSFISRGSMFEELPGTPPDDELLLFGASDTRRFFEGVEEDIVVDDAPVVLL